MAALLTGFPAVVGDDPQVLVLGSMPGVESLRRCEYYGHPRNAFWRIMSELFDFDPDTPYRSRINEITNSGIALWDVVHQCVRPGSLDSSIKARTVVANDISALLAANPTIGCVFFNGSRAEQLYKRHHQPIESIEYRRMPSTSPAHAAMPYASKLDEWRTLRAALDSPR